MRRAWWYLCVFGQWFPDGIPKIARDGVRDTAFPLKSICTDRHRLAYCWGLIMAIYLMGHGLVAVPRGLIRNSNLAGRLRRLQSQAPIINDKLTDATSELEELEVQLTQLRKRKNAVSRDHEEWIEDISDSSTMPDDRLSSSNTHVQPPQLPAVITDRYLAELSRKLIRARHKRARFIDTWDRLIQDAVDTQAVIDAAASKRLDFGQASPNSSWIERFHVLTPYTRYVVYSKLAPASRLLLAGFLALASISIVWSELIKFIAPRLSIISLTIFSHPNEDLSQVGFGGQVIASLWLFYMSLAALASFSDVKIWGNRALVRRNTYPESATWYATQVAKLTVPLAYNFLTFLPPTVHKETTFYHFLGVLINLTPLGTGFDYFFPIFILVPVCATLFNLYGRVKGIFGFGFLSVDDDEEGGSSSAFGTGGWREGRDLINREIHGAARLGLTPNAPLNHNNDASLPSRTAATLDEPASVDATSTSRQQPASRPNVPPHQSTYTARQAQRLADATAAAEEEDESFFQGFAHRVKNTIDRVERPAWMDDLGSGVKKPKWMGGVDGNTDTSGRAEAGRGMGRWFGGRPKDGAVRL